MSAPWMRSCARTPTTASVSARASGASPSCSPPALNAVFFFVMAVFRPDGNTAGASAMAFGLLLCVLADIQFGPLRREEGGTETATALVGLAYLLGGAGLLMFDARLGVRTLLSLLFAMATLAFAAA